MLELLRGAIDLHIHSAPSIFPRIANSIEMAEEAKAAGMRAIVLKNHHGITADRASLVAKAVQGIEVYGGVVLNSYAGGLNPYAVEAAVKMGAKFVWFPTQWAAHHLNIYGSPEYSHMKLSMQRAKRKPEGITVLNEDGVLKNETMEILEIVAAEGIAIGTAHLSKKEIKALVTGANEIGVKRIVVQHFNHTELWHWEDDEIKELVKLGAMMEMVAIFICPNRYINTPKQLAQYIDKIGPGNLVVGSDCGQLNNPTPVQGLGLLIQKLLGEGVSEKALTQILKENSAYVLGLE